MMLHVNFLSFGWYTFRYSESTPNYFLLKKTFDMEWIKDLFILLGIVEDENGI